MFLLALTCPVARAGSYDIRWDPRPRIHAIPDSFKKQSAVFVLLQRQMEYRQEGKEFFVYRTVHHIIRPLDDQGLEAFNKFTIPIGPDREITSLMARSILPDGRVVETGRDKARRIKNEQGYEEYLVALDGVSKGAEVELLYTERRPISLFGTERMQMGLPILKAEFRLITPVRFRFQTKGYNGFPACKDSVANKIHHYHASMSNIPALEDELYSYRDANLKKLAYRLSYATAEGGLESPRQFTWDALVRDLYKTYFSISKRQQEAVVRYLAAIGVRDDMSSAQKIQTIEEAMKSNISVSEGLDDDTYSDFETIIRKKAANQKGFVGLMTACLLQSGLNCELGLTSDRTSDPLDEQFEEWSILEQYIIHFPGSKTYLAPLAINYRYPFIPYTARGNKAVFCNREAGYSPGGSLIASIRSIPDLPMESSHNDIDATIRFKGTGLEPEADITRSFTGYTAVSRRDRFAFAPKNKEKEIAADILDIPDAKEHMLTCKVENVAFSSYRDNKPLTVAVTLQAPKLMEKAGNKFLFKVGDIIGEQSEMYHDDVRVLPIDVLYSHYFRRRIRIEIPKGYRITNPEAVKFNIVHKDRQGKELAGFISDYKMEAGVMNVDIYEFYDAMHIPRSEYPAFRGVVNAAADFNKVVLVLQQ